MLYRPVHTDSTFCDYTLSWNVSYDTQMCPVLGQRQTLGGNFVDVSLKVVVLNDAGTALASYLITSGLQVLLTLLIGYSTSS